MAQNDSLSEAPVNAVAESIEEAQREVADVAESDPAGPQDDEASSDEGLRSPVAVQQAAALWESALPEASVEACIEGILFVTDRPVSLNELARALDITKRATEHAVEALAADCSERGLRIQRNEDKVQLVSAPSVAPAIQRFLGLESASRLSRAALESLSIIAYRQPITRPEIDDLRGVNSDGVMRTLIARGLVEAVGRRETVGQPFEYGTNFRFLEYFGIQSLDDLPPVSISRAGTEPEDEDGVEAELNQDAFGEAAFIEGADADVEAAAETDG